MENPSTTTIPDFKDLEIDLDMKTITGTRVQMEEIIGKKITITSFSIEDTKVERFKQSGSPKCLYLCFTMDKRELLVFTRGQYLIKAMEKLGQARLPANTTIIKDNQKRLLFT